MSPCLALMSLSAECFMRLWVLLSCGALTACATHSAPQPAGKATALGTLSRCTVREVGRDSLLVEGGKRLYVEPYTMAANERGEAFLAGRFNYLIERGPAGAWQRSTDQHIFGAIVPRAGEPRVVRSPVPTAHLGSIQIMPREDGTWTVAFVEVVPPVGGSRTNAAVARLWNGTYDGTRWTHLDTIPRPAGVSLYAEFASSLLARGDTLFWAVRSRGEPHYDVVLFERYEGRWRSQVVPTRTAAEVELTYSDSVGLLLAVVQPDPGLRQDTNSLLLWARRPTWSILRRLVHGYDEGMVNAPQFTSPSSGGVLTWESEPASPIRGLRELRTRRENWGGEQRAASVVDSSVYHGEALVLDGDSWWVTDHISPSGANSEIRFVRDAGVRPLLVNWFPNPYATRFRAITVSPDTIVVTGAFNDTASKAGVVTLLLLFQVTCTN